LCAVQDFGQDIFKMQLGGTLTGEGFPSLRHAKLMLARLGRAGLLCGLPMRFGVFCVLL
jgi:hypothetical protein